MSKTVEKRAEFINAAYKMFGKIDTISRQQVIEVLDKTGLPKPWWLLNSEEFRSGRGIYKLPSLGKNTPKVEVTKMSNTPKAEIEVRSYNLVPQKIKGYVKFGHK